MNTSSTRVKLICVAFLAIFSSLVVSAQGAFNLINQRNHPELAWLRYETAHFRIVYSTGLDEAAIEAGTVAEHVYAIHQTNLGLSFHKKYTIFISDMDDILNGATTYLGYMFIWMNPANFLPHFTGTEGWLQKVIAHEMVHALVFENSRSILDFFLPLSNVEYVTHLDIMEGMAQFYAGEEWGTERGDRYLNLEIRNSDFSLTPFDIPFGATTYADGFAKVKWLRQTLSDQQIGQLFLNKNKWAFFNLANSYKRLTKRSFTNFENEYQRAINVYYNWREAVAERSDTIGSKLNTLPGDYVQVVKSAPGGQAIAFTGILALSSPTTALFIWDKASGKLRRLAQKGLHTNFSFDRAGRRIAFSRAHYGAHGSIVHDLFVVDCQTGKEWALTHDAHALEPVFTANDSLVCIRQQGLVCNLFTCRADGTEMQPLTDFTNEMHLADLSVSADGSTIITSYLEPQSHSYGIITLTLADKHVEKRPLPAQCRFPLFAPHNMAEILYTSMAQDVPNVYRLNLQTGASAAVTRQSNYVLMTDWPERDQALGIGQVAVKTNYALTLDPYRVPRSEPQAKLQEYYSQWRDTRPATPMAIGAQDAPGEFSGPFHSLSTFRFFQALPLPIWSREQFSLAVFALGADMLGKHSLQGAIGVNFQDIGQSDVALVYTNKATIFNIRAAYASQDATTFNDRAEKNSHERNTSASLQLTLPFERTAAFTTHELQLACNYEKSAPQASAAGSDTNTPSSALPALAPYRLIGFNLAYALKTVQPYQQFPGTASGINLRYGYQHSIGGNDFAYQQYGVTAFWQRPLDDDSSVLAAIRLQALAGTAPAQKMPGIARYNATDWITYYNDQIYLRGGNRYYPGDKLLTATLEWQNKILYGYMNAVVFADGALIWRGGLGEMSKSVALVSAGFELQMPLLQSIIAGFGAAKVLTQNGQSPWQYYFTLKPVLPF